MTWSPSETESTPSPTDSTTPAPSWPSTVGNGFAVAPVTTFQSLWQTPLAASRTSTSPGPGASSSTSSTLMASSIPLRTAARTRRFYGYARRMKTQAAVLWEPGRPVEILEVDLAAPQEGEVLVRIAACGVCHSDLHVVDGHLPEPLPLVLGHEAAGVVEETGPGVRSLEPGDHVVLALVPSCGQCEECRRGRPNFCTLGARMAAEGTLADGTSRLSLNGRTLHHFNSISVVRRPRGRPRVRRGQDPGRRRARLGGARRLLRAHRLRRGRQHGRRGGGRHRRRMGLRRGGGERRPGSAARRRLPNRRGRHAVGEARARAVS